MSLDGGEKIKLMPVTLDELIDISNREDTYFAEQEIVQDLLKAKIYPEKMEELKELFTPKEML